jgi:hypothetical protein
MLRGVSGSCSRTPAERPSLRGSCGSIDREPDLESVHLDLGKPAQACLAEERSKRLQQKERELLKNCFSSTFASAVLSDATIHDA